MEYVGRVLQTSIQNDGNPCPVAIINELPLNDNGNPFEISRISVGVYSIQTPIEYVGGYNKAACFVQKADTDAYRLEVRESDINEWRIYAFDKNDNPVDINGYFYLYIYLQDGSY